MRYGTVDPGLVEGRKGLTHGSIACYLERIGLSGTHTPDRGSRADHKRVTERDCAPEGGAGAAAAEAAAVSRTTAERSDDGETRCTRSYEVQH